MLLFHYSLAYPSVRNGPFILLIALVSSTFECIAQTIHFCATQTSLRGWFSFTLKLKVTAFTFAARMGKKSLLFIQLHPCFFVFCSMIKKITSQHPRIKKDKHVTSNIITWQEMLHCTELICRNIHKVIKSKHMDNQGIIGKAIYIGFGLINVAYEILIKGFLDNVDPDQCFVCCILLRSSIKE